MRVRANRATGFRAPNIAELYGALSARNNVSVTMLDPWCDFDRSESSVCRWLRCCWCARQFRAAGGHPDFGHPWEPYTNIGRLETDGFDFSLRYRLALSDLGLDDAGSLAFSIQGNYIDDFHRQNQPGSPIVQYAGRLETGPENGLFPRLRTNLTTTYARDSWSLGWTVRMSSRVRVLESQITTVGGIDKYAEIGERTITTPSDNSSCRRPLETCGSRPASRTSSTKRPRSPSREGDSAWGSDSEPHAPACEITPASCQLESASRDACDPAR